MNELDPGDIVVIITALEYFKRDIEDGEELLAGGIPVEPYEIDEIIRKLEA